MTKCPLNHIIHLIGCTVVSIRSNMQLKGSMVCVQCAQYAQFIIGCAVLLHVQFSVIRILQEADSR